MERNKKSLIYLDTHIVCWLYEGKIEKLSLSAIEAVESALPFVSPMVDLELQYLYEIKRLKKGPQEVLSTLAEDIGLRISETSFAKIVVEARSIAWTRDPFDRLITAEVLITPNAYIVTKDETIRKHCEKVIW